MKKWLSIGLLAGCASLALATVRTPKDSVGFTIPTLDYVGALPCTIGPSTGTTAVLCLSGRGVAYGVVVTSDTLINNTAVFRDSGTPNTTSSSFTAVLGGNPLGTGAQGTTGGGSLVATYAFKFPVPIQFTNGLSVNILTAPPQGCLWTILYRPLAATE